MRAATIIASCFGIGYFPVASGTVMSAVAALFALPIMWWGGPVALMAASLACFALGVYTCEQHVRRTGRKDPSECVIDELAGQWLACVFAGGLLGFVLAFVFFRLFDITKPWPISAAEKLPGGMGVMADDMLAGLAAGLCVMAMSYLGWA